jgi:DNA-binding transcriptional LysR family regulator
MHFCMGRLSCGRAVQDWDDLRYFLAVARAGSLSAAARVLGVTQPTVGRRLDAFQRRLGAKLFVRTPSGQVLSKTGHRLLLHAERIELQVLAASAVTSGRDAGLRGHVRITASEWMLGSVLGPSLRPFLLRHPELELELLADVRHLNLIRHEADIAIRPSWFEQKEVVQRELAVVAFGLYASDGYLAERGAPDFSRGGEGHLVIAMSESLGKVPDVTWLPELVGSARVAVRTNGRAPMATMAAAGIGMACLPRFVGDAMPGLRLLATPNPGPERRLWPRLKATVAFLVEAFGRLRPALCPRPA